MSPSCRGSPSPSTGLRSFLPALLRAGGDSSAPTASTELLGELDELLAQSHRGDTVTSFKALWTVQPGTLP